ncbi:MAG: hypothetical protein AAF696_13025 [Bacteroidota bacterium]
MNLKITASSLFLYLVCLTTYAQRESSCLRDFSLLSYQINTELGQVEVEQTLYLRDAYLNKLALGEYSQQTSETKYYEYLRPASKKEMKHGIEDAKEYERVFGDGNIYGLSFLPSHFHFFSPRPGFEGSLTGKWEDPYLVLPLGLYPVDSKSLSGVALKVVESNTDYLLLEANGDSYVFYLGYPDAAQVFIRAESVEQIDSRVAMSETFIGQKLFLENHPSLRYRKTPGSDDKQLAGSNPGMEVYISDALSYAEEVLLYCEKSKIYIVLDEYANFRMFDLACMETENEEKWGNYEDEQAELNAQVNGLIASGEPIIDLLENEWLVDLLQGRFRLHQNLKADKASYECLYLRSKDTHLKSFLLAQVDQEGNIYLQSQYSSERGLYHTKIEVQVGDQEFISDRIPALDPRSIRSRIAGRVVEEIHFQGGADNGILEAIAKNPTEEIQIRFTAGGSFYEDIILLPKYKDAIRDAWLLSTYIQNQDSLNARIRGEK